MKSTITSAVLGAVVLSQSVAGASIRAPGHAHLHKHRAAATEAAAPKEKRFVAYMSDTDVSTIEAKGIMTGKNLVSGTDTGPVLIGGDGPFLMNFVNNATEDLIVVCWSGSGQAGAVDASFIGAYQPDVTHTLQANTSCTVSFDPSQNDGSISGACSALYSDTILSTVSGQLDQTWLEFTYTTESTFSTTDVSRLVNMNGNNFHAANYASTNDTTTAACVTDMDTCSFVCPDGETSCVVGTIQNCAAGTENTSSNESGMDGGCTGMTEVGGYVVVTLS